MDTPIFFGPEADACFAKAKAATLDPRVLHYCVHTPDFAKNREMSVWTGSELFATGKALARAAHECNKR